MMETRTRPSVCIVHETFGRQSAISRIAAWNARVALAAGFRVSVVANELDEEWSERAAAGEIEHRLLKVPPRSFAVQWLAARQLIREALGAGSWDIVHVHQPQAIPLADVFQCHFLTRVARERGGFARGRTLHAYRSRLQQEIVLRAEDFVFRRPDPRTRFLFCSGMMQTEFARLYGLPPRSSVLANSAPPYNPPSEDERRAARRKLVGEGRDAHLVVGYLGGRDERKGYRRLLGASREAPSLFVLAGGPDSESIRAPLLHGRFRALGMLRDLHEFYAACDVVIVPSSFEPFGLVAVEAAAHGVPVIMTPRVGALPYFLKHGAGVKWNGRAPLEPVVRDLVERREAIQRGAQALCEQLSEAHQGACLLESYNAILREKGVAPLSLNECAAVPPAR